MVAAAILLKMIAAVLLLIWWSLRLADSAALCWLNRRCTDCCISLICILNWSIYFIIVSSPKFYLYSDIYPQYFFSEDSYANQLYIFIWYDKYPIQSMKLICSKMIWGYSIKKIECRVLVDFTEWKQNDYRQHIVPTIISAQCIVSAEVTIISSKRKNHSTIISAQRKNHSIINQQHTTISELHQSSIQQCVLIINRQYPVIINQQDVINIELIIYSNFVHIISPAINSCHHFRSKYILFSNL